MGMVTVEADGEVVDEWSSLIHLPWPLSRVGPTHVHGITRSMLKEAPELDTVLDEFGARRRSLERRVPVDGDFRGQLGVVIPDHVPVREHVAVLANNEPGAGAKAFRCLEIFSYFSS